MKFDDLLPLKNIVTTELNVEGYPSQYFIDKILAIKPHQCTLVPDADNQLTSDHGWDTIKNFDFLKDIVQTLQSKNIRTSLFIDADVNMIEHAAKLGVDRIEYYTGPFAKEYYINKENAISSIKETVEIAHQLGLGINAGHDLNLDNLKFFKNNVPYLEEVSIGHAIVCDALYFGLENTIKMYLHQINA